MASVSCLKSYSTKVVPTDQLLSGVWQKDFSLSNRRKLQWRLYQGIDRIRRKIEPNSAEPEYIRNVHHEGYMLDDSENKIIIPQETKN